MTTSFLTGPFPSPLEIEVTPSLAPESSPSKGPWERSPWYPAPSSLSWFPEVRGLRGGARGLGAVAVVPGDWRLPRVGGRRYTWRTGRAPREGADTHRGRRTAFHLICLLGPSREADWGRGPWPPAHWHGLCLEQLSLLVRTRQPVGPHFVHKPRPGKGAPPNLVPLLGGASFPRALSPMPVAPGLWP